MGLQRVRHDWATSVSLSLFQFFASSGQSIGVSALTSVLRMNTQDRFPLGWTGWISLQSKGHSRVFSNTTVQKHQFFCTQHFYSWTLTSIYDHWKNLALTRRTFVGKVMSLLFNMLSRLVITLLACNIRDFSWKHFLHLASRTLCSPLSLAFLLSFLC